MTKPDDRELEEVIRTVLKDRGPIPTNGIMFEVGKRVGEAEPTDVLDTLKDGPFYEDDSFRWHLGDS